MSEAGLADPSHSIFLGAGGKGRSRRTAQLSLPFANRHGLVAGATGTGKTVTLRILAEGLSAAGVPVFLADVKGDLTGILRARRLARATMANIKQNLFFALVYNAAGVPIAAGILYPFFGVLISPIFAAAAMSLSSVSVITNALRLGRTDLES